MEISIGQCNCLLLDSQDSIRLGLSKTSACKYFHWLAIFSLLLSFEGCLKHCWMNYLIRGVYFLFPHPFLALSAPIMITFKATNFGQLSDETIPHFHWVLVMVSLFHEGLLFSNWFCECRPKLIKCLFSWFTITHLD